MTTGVFDKKLVIKKTDYENLTHLAYFYADTKAESVIFGPIKVCFFAK